MDNIFQVNYKSNPLLNLSLYINPKLFKIYKGINTFGTALRL